MRSLASLRIGAEAIVGRILCSEHLSRRLQEIGFIPGAKVKAVMRAPLGDPTVYEVQGSRWCLRAEDAENIEIN